MELTFQSKTQIDWIKKQDPAICFLQETHLTIKNTHKLKVKGYKKIYHMWGNEKKKQE
jgi:exonuclease III